MLQENEELLNKEELNVNETLKLLLRRTAAISTAQFDLQLRYEHNASLAEQVSQQYSDITAAFQVQQEDVSDRLKMHTTEFNSLTRTVNSLLFERSSINESLSKLTNFTEQLSVSIGLNGLPLNDIHEQSMSKGEDVQGRSASTSAAPSTQLQMVLPPTSSNVHPSASQRTLFTRVLRDGTIVDDAGNKLGHRPAPLSLSGSKQSRPRHVVNQQSTQTKKRKRGNSASRRIQKRATEREINMGGARAEHTKIFNDQTTLHVLRSREGFYILKLSHLLSNQEFPDIILEQMFRWNDLKAERRLTMQRDKAGYWINKEMQIRRDALKEDWKTNVPDYPKPEEVLNRPSLISGTPVPKSVWNPADCFYMTNDEKYEDLVYLSKIYQLQGVIQSRMENAWLWGRHLWNEVAMKEFREIPTYKEKVRKGIELERDTRKLLENYELDSMEFAPEFFPGVV